MTLGDDPEGAGDITQILVRLRGGDRGAEADLISLVYPQLRKLAKWQLGGEAPDHTLQATALVHEVYLRMAGNREPNWDNRSHFFAVASTIMRRILVDHARERGAIKRGGGIKAVELEESVILADEQSDLVLALDDSLKRLGELDERQAKVVEMRFFAGLTNEEIASVLNVSTRTVKRDWVMAKAWLHAELSA